jgi:hypothetical protein
MAEQRGRDITRKHCSLENNARIAAQIQRSGIRRPAREIGAVCSAALPPHIAVSLWLTETGPLFYPPRLRLDGSSRQFCVICD